MTPLWDIILHFSLILIAIHLCAKFEVSSFNRSRDIYLFDPNFRVEGVAPTNHSSSRKTRLNDLSYGIKICTDFLLFCHNPRVLQTDGQTDRLTDTFLIASPCSAEKTKLCNSAFNNVISYTLREQSLPNFFV